MVKQNIVSFSGGKDSSAMLLRMIELRMPIDRIIFADTTLEFPEMYVWLDKIEKLIGMKIERTQPKKSFNHWVYTNYTRGKNTHRIRGLPYTCQIGCWWNRESKANPLKKAQGKGNNIYLGIAFDEIKRTKAKRFNLGENDFKFPLVDWKWTEQDCFDYLEKKGLKHPLSKFKRTGCWLCPKQSLGSLKILMTDYPELWEKLKQYEKDSPHGFKPNFKLKDFEEKYS